MTAFEIEEPLSRQARRALNSDLKSAAITLSEKEARYLVDQYYLMQEHRIRAAHQSREMDKSGEPHKVIEWAQTQAEMIENTLQKALDAYSASRPMGVWARSHVGIGPVIAAGLLAHIDITRAKTAGAIWRFAGLDPTSKWGVGQKRPWNAALKVLCWKMGDSFVKFSNHENCFYGHFYRQHKERLAAKDVAGGFEELADDTLRIRNFKDKAVKARYESGHLPDGRIDLMARRKAVKLFLAHYFEESWRQHYGTEPPLPYPIAHMGHAHLIKAPNECAGV